MNILVTGANGQLGNELRIVGPGAKDCFLFTDVTDASGESIAMQKKLAGDGVDTSTEHLDITSLEAIRDMVKKQDIQVIINCAAWTNVDGAEDPEKFELVELLNAKAPENLAIAMKEAGGLLVHISTDYVFGADPYNTPCREDQTGTPTYARDLAEAILVAVGHPVPGTYHYSNEGVCSWYDFARMIAEYAGRTACDIQPCHSGEFPSPVRRPAYSVLDKTKVKETFCLKIPYWTDSLKRCIEQL